MTSHRVYFWHLIALCLMVTTLLLLMAWADTVHYHTGGDSIQCNYARPMAEPC